jgi:kinesin family protein 5
MLFLDMQLKRLKLKKNNWSSESYRFDKVFTETASQKRLYEAVVKSVVVEVTNSYLLECNVRLSI